MDDRVDGAHESTAEEIEPVRQKMLPAKQAEHLEVCGIKLCRILPQLYNWNLDFSYRVPETIFREKNTSFFI